jgi:hypothetical protein
VAYVNPNAAVAGAVQALQGAIARLDALKQQPDADFAGIDAGINELQAQQTALRDQTLRSIEASKANRQAIVAVMAATAGLKTETASMQATAADLTNVAKVVTAATSLVAALAPFM